MPSSTRAQFLKQLSGLSQLAAPTAVAVPLTQLADSLTDSADSLTGTLAELACRLSGALPHLVHRPASTLTNLVHSPASTLTHLVHGTASTLTYLIDGTSGTLADLFDGISGPGTDLADTLAGPGADLLERFPDALEQFRVAIEGRQYAVNDCRDVIKTGPEQCLGFDALDVELNLPELRVDANAQLDQVQHLGMDRDPSLEVFELEMDLVDLDDWNVDQNVRLVGVADRARMKERVILILPLGDGVLIGLVGRRTSDCCCRDLTPGPTSSAPGASCPSFAISAPSPCEGRDALFDLVPSPLHFLGQRSCDEPYPDPNR